MKRKTANDILAESFREIAQKSQLIKLLSRILQKTAVIPPLHFIGISKTSMI